MKRRGRPILGVFAGFFFGLFVALDLVVFGVLPLNSDVLPLFPVLGIAAGVFMGLKAPIGRRGPKGKRLATSDPGPSAA